MSDRRPSVPPSFARRKKNVVTIPERLKTHNLSLSASSRVAAASTQHINMNTNTINEASTTDADRDRDTNLNVSHSNAPLQEVIEIASSPEPEEEPFQAQAPPTNSNQITRSTQLNIHMHPPSKNAQDNTQKSSPKSSDDRNTASNIAAEADGGDTVMKNVNDTISATLHEHRSSRSPHAISSSSSRHNMNGSFGQAGNANEVEFMHHLLETIRCEINGISRTTQHENESSSGSPAFFNNPSDHTQNDIFGQDNRGEDFDIIHNIVGAVMGQINSTASTEIPDKSSSHNQDNITNEEGADNDVSEITISDSEAAHRSDIVTAEDESTDNDKSKEASADDVDNDIDIADCTSEIVANDQGDANFNRDIEETIINDNVQNIINEDDGASSTNDSQISTNQNDVATSNNSNEPVNENGKSDTNNENGFGNGSSKNQTAISEDGHSTSINEGGENASSEVEQIDNSENVLDDRNNEDMQASGDENASSGSEKIDDSRDELDDSDNEDMQTSIDEISKNANDMSKDVANEKNGRMDGNSLNDDAVESEHDEDGDVEVQPSLQSNPQQQDRLQIEDNNDTDEQPTIHDDITHVTEPNAIDYENGQTSSIPSNKSESCKSASTRDETDDDLEMFDIDDSIEIPSPSPEPTRATESDNAMEVDSDNDVFYDVSEDFTDTLPADASESQATTIESEHNVGGLSSLESVPGNQAAMPSIKRLIDKADEEEHENLYNIDAEISQLPVERRKFKKSKPNAAAPIQASFGSLSSTSQDQLESDGIENILSFEESDSHQATGDAASPKRNSRDSITGEERIIPSTSDAEDEEQELYELESEEEEDLQPKEPFNKSDIAEKGASIEEGEIEEGEIEEDQLDEDDDSEHSEAGSEDGEIKSLTTDGSEDGEVRRRDTNSKTSEPASTQTYNASPEPEQIEDIPLWHLAHLEPSTSKKYNVHLSSLQEASALESNIHMWWYDAHEVYDQGAVYLFGKVYNKQKKEFSSGCVRVSNILRELYILPRDYKLNDEGESTDSPVLMEDVLEEIKELLSKKGITEYKCNVVKRKYAFDLPDVPSEADYIMLEYAYTDYEFSSSQVGNTFSHVFGAKTGPLERLLVKKRMMGPCWLELKNACPLGADKSWCSISANVDSLEQCLVMNDTSDFPQRVPLTILSINIQTMLNRQNSINEIIAASIYYTKDVDIDVLNIEESIDGYRYTFMRQPVTAVFPDGAREAINEERKKNKHTIVLENTEESLINALLAKVNSIDPDVVVGHNLYGLTLDVLIQRLAQINVEQWHKLSKLRLKNLVQASLSRNSSPRFVLSGRIVCDTSLASQDLIKSKSYHLSELASTQLKVAREDIKSSTLHSYFETSDKLIQLAKHCSLDAYLSFALMAKLQILALTKQLTNLAGSLWARSMNGARAERNEYLLLHTFYEKGYVCPDKLPYKKKRGFEFLNEDLELELPEPKRQKNANGKTSSFSGGLVLEPKAGLYDKFILLLDFNSLYPSIIQEYNVCFTTMDYQTDGEIPEEAASQKETGILPELVKMFVTRRQRLKKLMKNPQLSKDEQARYNIEQMSLKLTANSMYGCLGSSHSRFYAMPLAMFITARGRHILQSTVDLAKRMNLDVVYGDTDSVMINTNTSDFSKVEKIGHRFKAKVNKQYKLLEIDIDGFFKRTLLLKKKKYAALVVKQQPNGSLTESLEVKGLDLVRRDWCELSHRVSGAVLKFVLSDLSQEDVLQEVYRYLRLTATCAYNSDFPIEDFIIQKQLTKPLEEYNSSKGNPHVTVAMEMRRSGLAVRAGDVIPYIVCKTDREENKRSINEPRIPDDVFSGKAQIDVRWYLLKQILPPVIRICYPIEQATIKALASCLEIDTLKLTQQEEDVLNIQKDATDMELLPEQSQKKLDLVCSECGYVNEYSSPVGLSGLACIKCGEIMNVASVHSQVMLAIRKYVTKYYDSIYECNDSSCGEQSRDQELMAYDQCPRHGCTGRLVRKYSEKKLYEQLCFLSSLFDTDQGSNMEEIAKYQDTYAQIKQVINRQLSKSSYRYLYITDILQDVFPADPDTTDDANILR